jgi:rhodanese-related sulfurtransferase
MNTITPEALSLRLANEPSLLLFDVRTPVEFDEAHVKKAVNRPLDELAPAALISGGMLLPGQPVYLLCRSGQRAAKAAEKFSKAGYDHAVVVEGGTLAWIEAGFPVEKGNSRVISLERQVRIGAGSLVLAGALLGWSVHPSFFGLAAFVGAGLVFAGITDWCGMGLLLAKAPWNRKRGA